MNKSPANNTFIYFLNTEWEKDHRRPHVEGLSRCGRTVCVEYPITLLTPFLQPRMLFGRLRGKKNAAPAISFIRPFMPLPYAVAYRSSVVEYVNGLFLKWSLGKLRKSTKDSDAFYFLACPQQSCALNAVDSGVVVYDCYDAYSRGAGLSQKTRILLERAEEKIVRRSAVVFTTAKQLRAKVARINPNTYYFPNAAQVEHFANAVGDEPGDMAPIPRPRIGLIGQINDIADIGLLDFLAEKHGEWSIVLIGAVNGSGAFRKSKEIKKLFARPNVHVLGYRNYEDLPAYLKGIDVCLLPYLINEYTDCVHPNKIYQYLAQKKPIVSTNLKEVADLRAVIAVATTREEFAICVEEALRRGISDEKGALLLETALTNSIDRSTREKIAVAERCAAQKRAKLLFLYQRMSTFVEKDREILRERYDVREIRYRGLRDAGKIVAGVLWADITFSWFAKLHAFFAVVFSRLLAKKAIVIAGGDDVACAPELAYGSFAFWWKKWCPLAVFEYADKILPVSRLTEREIYEHAKANPQKVKMVYHGFDAGILKKNDALRKENIVLTICSINKETKNIKGLDLFIAAAGRLPHVQFILAGKDAGDGTLRELASAAPGNVTFCGEIHGRDFFDLCGRAKVYAQLSRRESYGCALAEAMLCECIPVVSRSGAIPEVVGDAGIYVDELTAEQAAEKIGYALRLSGEYGKRARQRIVDNFPLKTRKEALLAITAEVRLGGNKQRKSLSLMNQGGMQNENTVC